MDNFKFTVDEDDPEVSVDEILSEVNNKNPEYDPKKAIKFEQDNGIKIKTGKSIKEQLKFIITGSLVLLVVVVLYYTIKNGNKTEENKPVDEPLKQESNVAEVTETQTPQEPSSTEEYAYALERTIVPTMPQINETVYDDILAYEKAVVEENNQVYCVVYGTLTYFNKSTKIIITPQFYLSLPATGNLNVQYQTVPLDGIDSLINCKVLGVVK